ncbi:MAG: NAD-dependent epimerase/dehydratase family protein [Elusimicrobia bacterium]|nr:NAD-dependent epimerase/dehydratase family protein [Elusimicrobiota bacterium]
MPARLLLCGSTGFIGRNLLERFLQSEQYRILAPWHKTKPPRELARHPRVKFFKADLTVPGAVDKAVKGADVVIQAAATTSGSKDIVTRPYHHVTDNAIMNSLIFRACREHAVERVVFFSCTVMYPSQEAPVKENDFSGQITDKYFGVGWTKVYLEKMAEFYSRLRPTQYTVIRHSNIYGPHDKYDLEKSHVFGATVAKVMHAKDGKVVVWGDGTESRDLLYVDDLVDFVESSLKIQNTPFELVNVGSGKAVSVDALVKKIITASGKNLRVEYDKAKPSIPFKLAVDCSRAAKVFGWEPRTVLDEGIEKSLNWYRLNYPSRGG